MIWAYGITTIPERMELFSTTLNSLINAGFGKPRLFIDGVKEDSPYTHLELETTCRYPAVKTFGNWILALGELYLRNPDAERYALFQDDIVACYNLRMYLELCEFPDKGYWNLYTFPENQSICPTDHRGWYPSNQWGKAALGLVVSQEGVRQLLSNPHILYKPKGTRPTKCLDGAISDAFNNIGWQEYVHNPSLIQHTGQYVSSIGKKIHPLAPSFPGEEYNALNLLPQMPITDPNFISWDTERQAIERAIIDDEIRRDSETDPTKIKHYDKLITTYQHKLRSHLRDPNMRK